MKLFFKHKTPALSYDQSRLEPVIRCSICNGEQAAGFLDRQTGRFEEIMLIRSEADLQAFRDTYGIDGDIEKIY